MHNLRNARRRDEGGAVLILGALFAGIAIIAAALSIDIGALVLEKRSNQRIADLASLDGVRGLAAASDQRQAVEQLVVESAARNGFETTWMPNQCTALPVGNTAATFYGSDPSSWLTVEIGRETTATGFEPIPCPISYALESLSGIFAPTLVDPIDAVRVTVSSPVGFNFMPGGGRETAAGVGNLGVNPGSPGSPYVPPVPPQTTPETKSAGVRVGSTVVSIDATQASILNAILSAAGNPNGVPLGDPPGDLAVTGVGYEGLATANVGVEELATELGISAGTVDEVLNAGFSFSDLLTATANILDRDGNVSAAATLNEIESRSIDESIPHQQVDLGSFTGPAVTGGGEVFSGSEISQSELNVLDLVRGGAVLADGDHLVTAPLAVTVPGVTAAAVTVQLIEAAQEQYGPVGTFAKTAQIRTTLELTVPVSILGLGVVQIDLPVVIEGGGADAWIHDVVCPASYSTPTIPDVVKLAALTRSLSAQTLGWTTSALGGLVTISANPGSVVTTGGTSGGPWDYTASAFAEVHSLAGASLPALSVSSSAITVSGTLPLGVLPGMVTSTVANALNPVLNQLNGSVMPYLYGALGMSYGTADVTVPTAVAPSCDPATTTPGSPEVPAVPPTPESRDDLPVLVE